MPPPLPITCRITGIPFTPSSQELDCLARMGNMRGLLSEALPLPDVHPLEAARQCYSFGNLLYLYRSKSAHSGANQLARYNPALGYKISTLDEFISEKIDNSQFGRPYDFSRPFFEQWNDLMHAVYLPPLNNSNVEGSEYVNGVDNVKDCYLCFSALQSQDCMYCVSQYYGNDNIHCVSSTRSQFCYNCLDIDTCYECLHSRYLTNCNNCVACEDCIGCADCYGCIGLRNQRFQIFNQKYEQHQYHEYLTALKLNCYSNLQAALAQAYQFHKENRGSESHLTNIENSSGNYLRNCANVETSFLSSDCEDSGYLMLGVKSKDAWRGFAVSSELTYQGNALHSQNVAHCYSVFHGESCIYCYHVYQNCSYCFGCVGLRRKQYCILNQTYSKTEFNQLIPRIIAHMKSTGEWGRFFPVCYAPFNYYESAVTDFFEPLDPQEVIRRGYRVCEVPAPAITPGATTAENLPEDINQVDPYMLAGKPIACCQSGQVFNFQRKEIDFYKRMQVPLPRRHWRISLIELMHSRELFPAVK